MALRLHPEAAVELRRAAIWYHERREGLGEEFLVELTDVFNRIASREQSFP